MIRFVCEDCGRSYGYEIDVCSFCRTPLQLSKVERGVVTAVTEVSVPSLGHEDVPYWCTLVLDERDDYHIRKHDSALKVGDQVSLTQPSDLDLPVVGVLGTGVMGRSLVELLLSRGHRVCWVSRSSEHAGTARAHVLDRLARVMDERELKDVDRRLLATEDIRRLEECDVVIEAVIEKAEAKARALMAAEAAMRPEALLASNTSGLSLDELSANLEHPERFGALHFFNPATRMRLVETSRTVATSDETVAALDEIARLLGKVPIHVAQRPAFIVNRVLMPLINEAVRSFEEGAASAHDIDEAVRLGLNHPMGPLALADLIGIDVVVSIMDNLAVRTGDDYYAPRPTLRKLALEGRTGRKAGTGFYEYAARPEQTVG